GRVLARRAGQLPVPPRSALQEAAPAAAADDDGAEAAAGGAGEGGRAMIALLVAAALSRDPALLHKHVEQLVAEKEAEREQALRRLLELGGSPSGQAEVLARLAGLLRARGLGVFIRAQAEADSGDEAAAARDRAKAADARAEAIARYRELIRKYPGAPKLDEALFFLADTLQDSGFDLEAVETAREVTRRVPKGGVGPRGPLCLT